jgi:hypothetical protein
VKIYIGHDARQSEREAFAVAASSALRYGCEVVPLYEERLRMSGMLTRPTDRRAGMFDLNSNAPQSRNLRLAGFSCRCLRTPGGRCSPMPTWCLCKTRASCLALADNTKALHVVKHAPVVVGGIKMDGQVQTTYPRKWWSSVILWNADHPANARLNLVTLNQWPGRDLHAFRWLHDDEIGELPGEANWLVGIQPKPARPVVAHFTLGTPNMLGLEQSEHADIWWDNQKATQ